MSTSPRANTSRAPLIVAAVIGLGMLLGLNVMQQRADPAYQKRLEEEKQQEEAKKQAEQAVATPAPGASPDASANRLAALGDSVQLGDPKATTELVLGWEWTPEVQADPAKVTRAVDSLEDMVKRSGGRLKARIVNRDVNPQVEPGLAIGTRGRIAPRPDGSIDVQTIMPALGSVMQGQFGTGTPPPTPSPSP